MTGHIHARLMLQYAQDATETDTPWERWQYAADTEYDGCRQWRSLVSHPDWQTHLAYRRKSRTVRIGDIDVPEPMRTMPPSGSRYYAPDLGIYSNGCGATVVTHLWQGDEIDVRAFRLGLCYKTPEDARARLDAENALAWGNA